MDGPSSTVSRRAVLGGLAVAGCGTLAGYGMSRGTGDEGPPVSLFAAGSLANAVEHGLAGRVAHPLRVNVHGSAALARMVASGRHDPDLVSLADASLFESALDPAWYAEFATNALVVAYNPETEGGRRVAEAGVEGWYEPVLAGEARLGRTDPDLDPLGYRTLFMLELASRYYGTDVPLRERVPVDTQVYPETQLVSQFETGGIDAAVTYRNMAVERGYDYVDLPSRIDFGDPRYVEDWYATTTYSLPSGRTVRGGLISYATTVRTPRDAAFDVFDAHLDRSLLREFGFTVPEDHPRYTGDVPERVEG